MISAELVREILRHKWNLNVLQLFLAACVDRGPCQRREWAMRSGVDEGHMAERIALADACRVLKPSDAPEGTILTPLPPQWWKLTPRPMEAFARAWGKATTQTPLDLSTEMPSLVEMMAVDAIPKSGIDPQIGDRASPLYNTFTRSTFVRSNVGTLKRPDGAALREKVRVFVGDGDYAKFWGKPCYDDIFAQQARADALDASLCHLKAGVVEGSVKIRTTRGRALWDAFQRRERETLKREQ